MRAWPIHLPHHCDVHTAHVQRSRGAASLDTCGGTCLRLGHWLCFASSAVVSCWSGQGRTCAANSLPDSTALALQSDVWHDVSWGGTRALRMPRPSNAGCVAVKVHCPLCLPSLPQVGSLSIDTNAYAGCRSFLGWLQSNTISSQPSCFTQKPCTAWCSIRTKC